MPVQLICCSHSPLMTTDIEESQQGVQAQFFSELESCAAALRAFRHLESRQRPDGGWFQNWFVDGTPHWTSTELDQVALPVLLAWRLGVAG